MANISIGIWGYKYNYLTGVEVGVDVEFGADFVGVGIFVGLQTVLLLHFFWIFTNVSCGFLHSPDISPAVPSEQVYVAVLKPTFPWDSQPSLKEIVLTLTGLQRADFDLIFDSFLSETPKTDLPFELLIKTSKARKSGRIITSTPGQENNGDFFFEEDFLDFVAINNLCHKEEAMSTF